MEYVEGRTLAERIAERPMTRTEILEDRQSGVSPGSDPAV